MNWKEDEKVFGIKMNFNLKWLANDSIKIRGEQNGSHFKFPLNFIAETTKGKMKNISRKKQKATRAKYLYGKFVTCWSWCRAVCLRVGGCKVENVYKKSFWG